jgi:GNAT superfamily N-acetyltransferase
MNRALIVELTYEDRESVIDVLAESFRDYPFFTFALEGKTGSEYERSLRALIGFFVDARLMRGWPVLGIREGSTLSAAMLISDPVVTPRPDALNSVYEEVRSEVGNQVLARLDEFESALDACEPSAPTFFVGMVGVRPEAQGKGFGRALMEHVAKMAYDRPDSAGVTLTTETKKNLPFYQRLGYRVLGSAEVGPLTTWLMMLDKPAARVPSD